MGGETKPKKTIVTVNGDPNHWLQFDDELTAKTWIWFNSARFSSLEMFVQNTWFAGGAQPTPIATSNTMRDKV